jgi:hypothetical protein
MVSMNYFLLRSRWHLWQQFFLSTSHEAQFLSSLTGHHDATGKNENAPIRQTNHYAKPRRRLSLLDHLCWDFLGLGAWKLFCDSQIIPFHRLIFDTLHVHHRVSSLNDPDRLTPPPYPNRQLLHDTDHLAPRGLDAFYFS